MINCLRPPECSSGGQCCGQEEVVVVCFWPFDVDNWGVVDMLVLAELRQSGSLPCLWRYLERLELAGASLWQPRWGGTEKRDGGAGLKVRTLSKERDHMTSILNCKVLCTSSSSTYTRIGT